MKKVLYGILTVLAVLLTALYLVSESMGFSADLYLGIVLGVFCVCAWRYGGIRCPNCGCRVNAKYGRNKSFEGRFPCPKCGTMIEL